MDTLDALLAEPTAWALVSAALLLGLGEGIKPGPLNTLVITDSETANVKSEEGRGNDRSVC